MVKIIPEYVIEFIIAVFIGVSAGACFRIHRYVLPFLVGLALAPVIYSRDLNALKPAFNSVELLGIILGVWLGEILITKLMGREYLIE